MLRDGEISYSFENQRRYSAKKKLPGEESSKTLLETSGSKSQLRLGGFPLINEQRSEICRRDGLADRAADCDEVLRSDLSDGN